MRHQRRIAAALTAAVLGTGIATAVPVTAAAAEPPTDGLVLHYALTGDGGTTAVDLSGSGRDGQIIGGAEPSADGLTLDGVDDYVDMPDNIMAGLDEISIAFQVQIDPTLGGVYFIYGMGNTSAGGIGDGYLFTEGNPYRATIASGNWETEENTQASHNLDREVWKHLTYTQSGGTGVLYEDGVEVARNDEVTITPGSIGGGVTTANYIGRSLYAPDPYFKGAVQDFRIYDRALAVDEVETLASPVVSGTLEQDAAELTLGDTSAVVTDLALPTLGAQGSAISWASSDAGVVTAEGVVTRPAFGSEAATATLTATLTRGAESTTRAFDVTVLPEEDDQSRADTAAAELVVHNVEDVRGNLTLLTTGPDGATVSWESSDPAVITATGDVNRPAAGAGAAAVELTATVTIGSATATRVFQATVPALPAEQDYEGYLFTYFLGEGQEHGEQVYYGLSEGNDPTSWDVLNDGEPVLVSTSGEMGLRDPYIVRSPEGDKFYQIATDLRMWNQSSGSWGEVQRQGSRNIVVWESTDLVNWSESWVVEVAPEEAGNAWAPETFYDEESGEYVVFWASNLYAEDDPEHTGSSYNRMMYSTTRDFRTFSEPAILIDAGQSVIDTTMIEHDGDVYRFSKNEANRNAENPGGKHVFQEVGSSVLADDFQLIAEGVGAGDINQGEGPLVFKSNTEERWYLFIDEYGGRGYVPFTTTDLASGEWTMLAAGEFSFPARFRHGAVLPVTGAEWQALQDAYGEPTDAESVEQDLSALEIPNVDDVRGNITLPTEGDNGTTFAWTSSAPAVITTTGEVTRPAIGSEPAEVTLTVTATKGDVTDERTFVATVQPLVEQEELEAYFFPHFKGESGPEGDIGEQIYFAASRGNNALDWQVLNDDESVLVSTMGEQGLRDPFIIRSHEGDKFFMLATDLKAYTPGGGPDFARAQETGSRSLMVWESTDLVNWGEQRMVEVSSPLAGNTWAPEATYSEELGAYVVYWASNLYPTAETEGRDTRDSYNRMMYSITRDFVNFTDPEIWIDIRRDAGRGMIDSTVIEHDDMYYRFTKDERNDIMEVLLEKSPDLLRYEEGAVGTTWELITERIGSGDPLRHAEGPTVFKANPGDVNVVDGQDKWFLFQDWPPYGGGDGYVAFESTDLDDPDSWTHRPELNLSARHGTVLPVTQAEYERLLANYQPDALVESVDDVELSVEAGVAPVLPATVTAQFADGSTGPFGVVWDEVHPSSYAAAGHFTVRGTLEAGMPVEARAVVTVTAAPAGVPTFVDVVDGQVFYDEIRWMAEQGLSHGTVVGDVTFFYPAQAVSRQAMAAFIYRYAGADYTPPAGTQSFTDVGPDHPLYAEIEWMHAQGLTEGYADGSFGTTRPVSRQAMAAFLHRLAGSPEASSAAPFTDVAAGSQFAEAIGWLAEADITDGYPDGSFGITRPVTRQAMAAFLHRYDEFVSALRVVQG